LRAQGRRRLILLRKFIFRANKFRRTNFRRVDQFFVRRSERSAKDAEQTVRFSIQLVQKPPSPGTTMADHACCSTISGRNGFGNPTSPTVCRKPLLRLNTARRIVENLPKSQSWTHRLPGKPKWLVVERICRRICFASTARRCVMIADR